MSVIRMLNDEVKQKRYEKIEFLGEGQVCLIVTFKY